MRKSSALYYLACQGEGGTSFGSDIVDNGIAFCTWRNAKSPCLLSERVIRPPRNGLENVHA